VKNAGLGREIASLVLCVCIVGSTAACSGTRVVGGRPTAPPAPMSGNVDVTIALSDSFDVLPGGKCAGRHLNQGVRDGASIKVFGLTDNKPDSPFTPATASATYDENDFTRRPDDDGKFCLVHFTFVPHKPDLAGYFIEFPLGKGQRGTAYTTYFYSFWSDPIGGRGYGVFQLAEWTCADRDASPERRC
jgi:hypothetical protein